ncbi:hypothetical protein HPP92_018991 [Vanilla planifolia]|uniref:Uncharacterized protein n=1 Tax=Vanilla planifolia TaxID=51239 RepID=A0A835UJY3_VANPL|nr:hypothetical protein HPP92_019549 [Vanilla planifolia]KAG0464827.1 hypothetical protein HPP92_018991 [Vanilla planifolia]
MARPKLGLSRLQVQSMPSGQAKPQQAASVLEKEKNGLHPQIDRFDALAPAAEEEAMLADQDELKGGGATAAIVSTGVASNLSRKKATPPQPTSKKQLVIKLNKGMLFFFIIDTI